MKVKLAISTKLIIAAAVSSIALLSVILVYTWRKTTQDALMLIEDNVQEKLSNKADIIVDIITNDKNTFAKIIQNPKNTLNISDETNTLILDKINSLSKIDNNSYPIKIYLVSNKGSIVNNTGNSMSNEIVSELVYFEENHKISSIILNGNKASLKGKNNQNRRVFLIVKPIYFNNSALPWSIIAEVEQSKVLLNYRKTFIISILIGVFGIIALLTIIYIAIKVISNSISQITKRLNRIASGELHDIEALNINTGDEYETLANSVNKASNTLRKAADFAIDIGQGNLSSDFSSESKNDLLGNSLLDMRNSLNKAKEEEELRQIEDTKRNWATEGLAKFSEILRADSNDLKKLSYNIMSNLIEYLNANQGAIFVIDDSNEDDIQLELTSTIAYDREKLIKRKLRIGEELVGQCAFEKETIYMTQIPDNYISITSGLGTSNPSALLLVPLLINEEVYGVIEMASFKEFEGYQIEFIERLGESMASAISSVRTNERTTRLLNQSKEQTEELAAQEEEMRQNMEELQATQEEAQRREYEMNDIIKALSTAALTVEYETDGTIISVNEKYTNLLGISANMLIGKNHKEGYDFSSTSEEEYKQFWNNLRNGIPQKEVNKVKYNNKEIWLEENYAPVSRAEGEKPHKIFKISFDITAQKLKENELQNKELDTSKFDEQKTEYELKLKDLKIKEEELQKALIYEKENAAKEIEKIKAKIIQQEEIKEIKKKEQSKPTKLRTNDNEVKSETSVGENALLEWNDDLTLGIQEIDQQHEQLISLANQILDGFKHEKSKKEIKDALRNFIDFTSYHFGTEEEYFAQSNYTKSKEHILEHKAFIKKLKAFQTEYSSNKKTKGGDISTYILSWISNHINIEDRLYIEEFKKLGL